MQEIRDLDHAIADLKLKRQKHIELQSRVEATKRALAASVVPVETLPAAPEATPK